MEEKKQLQFHRSARRSPWLPSHTWIFTGLEWICPNLRFISSEGLRAPHKWPPLAHPMGWVWSWCCCASCRAVSSFWKWVCGSERCSWAVKQSDTSLCSLLSQPATIPALIAAFMCFIVCFITRSRVKPNLHHSTETNSAKEDTGDAPVFVSLSSQPSQIFARNKIIKGLTPLSHPQHDLNDWNVELFQTSQVGKQKGCSITLIISLLNTWADDNSERIYRNVCPQSAAKPYLGITSIQWF